MNVAFGRLFSRVPVSGCGPVPSSKSIVAVSVSSQPGSVMVPVIVVVPDSLIAGMGSMVTDGATFVTVTVAVSVSEAPSSVGHLDRHRVRHRPDRRG